MRKSLGLLFGISVSINHEMSKFLSEVNRISLKKNLEYVNQQRPPENTATTFSDYNSCPIHLRAIFMDSVSGLLRTVSDF